MKKCIVQYWITPDTYSEPDYNRLLRSTDQFDADAVASLSKKSFQKYADKYGHDFIRIESKKINFKHPTFERFDIWLNDEWWEEYDEIMYTDSDVFAMPDSHDIFSEYPDSTSLKVCDYPKFQQSHSQEHFDNWHQGLLKECTIEECQQKGFQPGVFIVTKSARDLMKSLIAQFKDLNDHDGNILMWATIKSGVPVTRMSELYNFKNAHFNGAPQVNFFHAHGHKKLGHWTRIKSFLKSKGIK